MTAPGDLERVRGELRVLIPRLIRLVAHRYHAFAVGGPDPAEPKDFGAHHSACKTALGHLEHLVKLSKWAAADGGGGAEGADDPAALVARARAAVAALSGLDGDDGKDDDPDGAA